MTDRDYQHSRILDVHRWSEHQEANLFVDEVYDTFLNRQERDNPRIQKKHLKVILLDLYVAWLNDPDLNIAVHMSPAAYPKLVKEFHPIKNSDLDPTDFTYGSWENMVDVK